MFYAAAECYDSAEEKKLAARYYTLAGQTFYDLNTRRAMRKAAAAYGKAITRYLIADDLQGATFLLEKGKKQEFDTYHFKMAEDALERKISDLELAAAPELELIEEAPKSEIALPKIVPLAEPLEVPSEITDILIDYEEVKPVLESFAIEEQIDEISDEVGRALLENVSETFKSDIKLESSSTVSAVTDSGQKITIEPHITLIPLKDGLELSDTTNSLAEIVIPEPDDLILDEPSLLADKTEIKGVESQILIEDLERETTVFDSISEVFNELEESVTDVEVVDRIPFAWQVIGVDAGDLKLMKKEVATDGLLFTWSKDRLSPGESVQIKYHLRKRIHRSIVLRQGKNISLLSTYHSIHEKGKTVLSAEIPYTNASGKAIDEVLIEDTIPPELIPRSYQPKVTMPAMISGVDETIFRWLLRGVFPGFHIGIAYDFAEKPITRWFERSFEGERGTRKVKVKKIAQPSISALVPEMLLVFELSNSLPVEFELLDEIPADAEVVAVEPTWQMPKIESQRNQKFLLWSFDFKANDRATIILRVRSSLDYAAPEPIVKFKDYEIMEGKEIQKEREKMVLDLRTFSSRP
ncbi:MAG: hypothetical protein ACFFGZ_09460 [Candidatus Thorarchaeota archaeon]